MPLFQEAEAAALDGMPPEFLAALERGDTDEATRIATAATAGSTAIVTITTGDRLTARHVLALDPERVEPEWRTPILLVDAALDGSDQQGRRVRNALASLIDDHRDQSRVEITVDGVCVIDACGCDALDDLAFLVAQAERSVLNP